ncbi:GTP 3',8-cyclase MoaA [Anaeromyxobacter sp. Fw109-5]|uniref:GTP 3',8-cyclase MoaA n=1 Tax=Anaeromyxobacter sp. (strain Fw109-5) TaxID=404589 RepID=UPI00032376EC|nr:GTP 3',8-cyclase MoaA [Anaeromyxobacter sp. Fw109-5]
MIWTAPIGYNGPVSQPDGAPPVNGPLLDGQGRKIQYLRLSLTDRCNFRCSYCAPMGPDRQEDPLTRPELARVVGVFARLGIRRVRLTGGEPTLRRELLDIVRDVRATPGIEEIALTTNGHALATHALLLREAGVTRLNVSLDTLDPQKLQRISGRAATLERIVSGIEAAFRVGFASVKLNVVVVRGENEDELGNLARFAWRFGATARFIELMPFGPGKPVPTAEVKRLLEAQGIRLEPDATRGWGPAYHMRGSSAVGGEATSGLVGFIGAMTENFCDGCNRVRVGADGSLRACLGGRDRAPLRELIRAGASDEEIAAAVRAALLAKGEKHEMPRGGSGLLPMIGSGG